MRRNPLRGVQEGGGVNKDLWKDFTLEDFIRYLAAWPRDLVSNKDELLDSILVLCGVWVKVIDGKSLTAIQPRSGRHET